MSFELEVGSFRDPSGFVFYHDGILYRQVNHCYEKDFYCLKESGLYDKLTEKKLLISHDEVNIEPPLPEKSLIILCPQPVPFISYPYEWCFSQLKDAALTTLVIQKQALQCGMSLKDASAYNIQYLDGRPVFIDTLSFEVYQSGKPWSAYRQFCQHFLAPLALMSYKSVEFAHLLKHFIDGIPLNLATSLLPWRTFMAPSLVMHIHFHSKAQNKFQANELKGTPSVKKKSNDRVSLAALNEIVENLESAIRKLKWSPNKSAWRDYYDDTNYVEESFQSKKDIVAAFLKAISPRTVWDLGANTGIFSKIAADMGAFTVSADMDSSAVELNYLQNKKQKNEKCLPLLLDLVNPSGGIGWDNRERKAFFERGEPDVVMALALIHHLSIGNNVPLKNLAAFFAGFSRYLIVEFVPKSDSQVKRLLQSRDDIFPDYEIDEFERIFGKLFTVEKKQTLPGSERTLFLFKRK
jgi:2-polyprenyl-3-methyl-5-hydroxy-6-metoxy-1,4-benzoquinol methylase